MKVLTIGSAMIDSIAIIAGEKVERMSMRNADTAFLLLEEGKKIEAEAISTHCGGGAVNAAVCYARLGFDVAALVKLGRDQRAEQVLARLADEGVSARHAMRDSRAPTGASVLVSAHDRNAAIFTFRGANTLLEPADLKAEAFGVDLVHVASLSNKSADCFPAILAKAKAGGAKVAVNPGIRQLSLHSDAVLGLARDIDILSLNATEADALVPQVVARAGEGGPRLAADGEVLPALMKRGFASGGFEVSFARLVRTVLDLGVKCLIVTDGARGAFAAGSDEISHCPSLSGEVAGTAGAGDAFVATFAAFSVLGAGTTRALQCAALNAGSVIRHPDTQTGLLQRAALEERLADTTASLMVRSWPLPPSSPGEA